RDPRRDPGARAPGRRQRVPALRPHHRADGAADPARVAPVLGHLQLHRFQHHLDHHQGRTVRSDPGAVDVCLSGRRQCRLSRTRRRDLAVHVPDHGDHRVLRAALPPAGGDVMHFRWLKNVTTYVGLAPFLAFALFPFYWGLITSFKADANLYDLQANPFWFASNDRSTGKPYHKDIIVPASFPEGPIRWEIRIGAHTTRSDSEQNPAAIAFIGERKIESPVDGTLSEITVADGQTAHPNDVIGVIQVASPTLTHYKFLRSTPFYTWLRVSLVTGAAVV